MKRVWLVIPLMTGCVDLGKLRDQISKIEQSQKINAEKIGNVSSTAVTKQEVAGIKAEVEASLDTSIIGFKKDVNIDVTTKLRDANIDMKVKLSAVEQRIGDMEGSGSGGILGIGGSGGIAFLVVFVFIAAGTFLLFVLLRRIKGVQLSVDRVNKRMYKPREDV